MKVPPEELWSDVIREIEPPDFREAVLRRALLSARHRRFARRAGRGALAIALLVSAVLLLRPSSSPQPDSVAPSLAIPTPPQPPYEVIPGTSVRVISDEELLALFEGRPRGLIGPPGQRQLVLLDQILQ
jgi:hypothetical protein